ncbi:MAG: apolipoprotein N-acyltransferase, partial [Planctomycetales bacterium]|nr:apolipoprotein N-acyltransferase [Planctomycetales bacterium]
LEANPAHKNKSGSRIGRYGTWWACAFSGITLWAAFPPLGWWPLAWLAPLGWLWLVTRPKLPGHHPYRVLYVASWLHWMAVLQWVRLPHWSAYFGWVTLTAYLAIYPPLFVAISRCAIRQRRWRVVWVAPLVWAGLEFFRCWFLTGFAMGLLGHTQAPQLRVIQVCDLGGVYLLSLLLMTFAASLLLACQSSRWAERATAMTLAVLVPVLVISYGHWRLNHVRDSQSARMARVALIQGSVDTVFDDPSDPEDVFRDYLKLTHEALSPESAVDLVVWPESMYTGRLPWIEFQLPAQPPDDFEMSDSELRERLEHWHTSSRERARWAARQTHTPMLVGCESDEYGPHRPRRYNSALWFDAAGDLRGRYDKMHPVMFGEYVPLGSIFPSLYRLTPMGDGLTAGQEALAVKAGDLVLSPSICFENIVPHLLRRQVRQLAERGESADVLVTITNDGWFWGSSLLDMHLACGVFRAVELRKPLLIAANTGFSAVVGADGAIQQRGPRRATGYLVTDVRATNAGSMYLAYGDWLGVLATLFCAGVVSTRGVSACRVPWSA